MELCLLNPFVRNVCEFAYRVRGCPVYVTDYRLLYIREGTAWFLSGGEMHRLGKDSIYFCPPGGVYEILTGLEGEDPHPVITSLNFDLTMEDRADGEPRTPIPYTGEDPERPASSFPGYLPELRGKTFLYEPYRVFQNVSIYRPYFTRLMTLFYDNTERGRLLCSCVMKELLIELHTAVFAQRSDSASARIASEVKLYLDTHFAENVTVLELASRFGYHANSLGRLFRKTEGVTILQYVLNLRIAEAKRLLAQTALPVSEVARRAGFSDVSYFSDYFKRRVGLSPGELRRRMENNI